MKQFHHDNTQRPHVYELAVEAEQHFRRHVLWGNHVPGFAVPQQTHRPVVADFKLAVLPNQQVLRFEIVMAEIVFHELLDGSCHLPYEASKIGRAHEVPIEVCKVDAVDALAIVEVPFHFVEGLAETALCQLVYHKVGVAHAAVVVMPDEMLTVERVENPNKPALPFVALATVL